jgi:hypothetical protein
MKKIKEYRDITLSLCKNYTKVLLQETSRAYF